MRDYPDCHALQYDESGCLMEIKEVVEQLGIIAKLRRKTADSWIEVNALDLAKTPIDQAIACETAIELIRSMEDDGK